MLKRHARGSQAGLSHSKRLVCAAVHTLLAENLSVVTLATRAEGPRDTRNIVASVTTIRREPPGLGLAGQLLYGVCMRPDLAEAVCY